VCAGVGPKPYIVASTEEHARSRQPPGDVDAPCGSDTPASPPRWLSRAPSTPIH